MFFNRPDLKVTFRMSSLLAALLSQPKDDVVGLKGDYTFSVKELVANDGLKLDLNKQFFFGETAWDKAHQDEYLAAHGIVKISDANGGTYRINAGAKDFDYSVQNAKGQWVSADVDVIAPVVPKALPVVACDPPKLGFDLGNLLDKDHNGKIDIVEKIADKIGDLLSTTSWNCGASVPTTPIINAPAAPAAQDPKGSDPEVNNAAKDDVLGNDGHFTFTWDTLLANDPGGANKNGLIHFGTQVTTTPAEQAAYMAAHGIVANSDGSFTLTRDAIDFDYIVEIGNKGTWSTAHVDVTAPLNKAPVVAGAIIASATETLSVYDTAAPHALTNTGADNLTVNLLQGASDQEGDALSIVQGSLSYSGGSLPAWAKLVGNSLVIDQNDRSFDPLAAGEHKLLGFTFQVSDGHGGTTTNSITVDLVGTVENIPVDQPPACVIADIAHNGSFEITNAILGDASAPGWGVVNVADWYNTGASNNHIEVWNQAGLDARNPGLVATGGQVIETDGYGYWTTEPGTGALVKDAVGTHVEAVDGKTYTVSFDFASRGDWSDMPSDTDGFDVYWNGDFVQHFDPTSTSTWHHASFNVTGAAGLDSLEFRETGDNDAYGALIDNVKVVGCNAEFTPGATTAPVDQPPVVETPHDDCVVASWDFEQYTQAGGDEIGVPQGFWDLSQWAASHPGVYGADADAYGFAGYMQVHGVDGHRALDTAASPGNIFLQAIPEGRGGPGASMPDLVAGKDYYATVEILKQHFDDAQLVAEGHDGTDPDAWVSFQFNGQSLNVRASDIHVVNQFVKFGIAFQGVEGEDNFVIQSHGTHDDPQGLLIDSISISACKPTVGLTGNVLFEETFDGYAGQLNADSWGTVNLTGRWQMDHIGGGAWATPTGDANNPWLQVNGEIVQGQPAPYEGSIASTSGNFWLDTQNSPGGINISNYFTDNTGGAFQLSFDIGIHDFGTGSQQETAHDALFQVSVDNQVVATLTYDQVLQKAGGTDKMAHFDFVLGENNAAVAMDHGFNFHDVTPSQGNFVGFSLDTVQIHDWVI